jgi:hypothetical protein
MTTPTTKMTTPARLDTSTPTPKVDTSGLSQNLVASTSPTTPHSTADAARAMSSTGAWQPRLDRRQSWDSQEYKHVLQEAIITTTDGAAESGFTERRWDEEIEEKFHSRLYF